MTEPSHFLGREEVLPFQSPNLLRGKLSLFNKIFMNLLLPHLLPFFGLSYWCHLWWNPARGILMSFLDSFHSTSLFRFQLLLSVCCSPWLFSDVLFLLQAIDKTFPPSSRLEFKIFTFWIFTNITKENKFKPGKFFLPTNHIHSNMNKAIVHAFLLNPL